MIRCKQLLLVALAAGLISAAAWAQEAAGAGASPGASGSAGNVQGFSFEELTLAPEGRALLALTNPDYPVTPGDIYQLSFLSAQGVETLSLIVDASLRVNAGVFGLYEVRGRNFDAFRRQIEEAVAKAYPGSSPQLAIRSTGVFSVQVLGEVGRAGEAQAWGLARLSSLYRAYATAYASERRIAIRAADGRERVYDLFLARRYGDLSQDPYLKPGDRVILTKAERRVSISGEVRRPGGYELLEGEGLEALIERYADGLTPIANLNRLSVVRVSGDTVNAGLGERSYLRYAESRGFMPAHLDSITVPSLEELRPVAWFEGALGPLGDGTNLDHSNRIPYTFVPGELLSSAVRALRGQFRPSSDLAKAYLSRNGSSIAVDLGTYLYDKDFSVDYKLEAGDLIVVPFRQLFVTVSGAVRNPGRYPYIPDRRWEYYVALAGGFDADKNAGDAVSIFDQTGKAQVKARFIQPEDIIEAKNNSLIYGFSRVAGIIGTTISVASLIISIFSMTR